MPQVYTVDYSTNGSSWTNLPNIESISAFIGRGSLVDQFEPSRATITARYPTGFSSPIAALVVGTWIRFSRTGGQEMWRGKIRNVAANWGQPYRSGTGAADFLTIECEGALAEWGRSQGDDYAVIVANAYFQLADVAFQSGLPIGTTYSSTDSPTVGASVVDNTWATWLNQFAATLGSTIKDGSFQVGVYTKDFIGLLPFSFSDVTNNSSTYVYDELTFDSLAADYYTQVQVDINTGAIVTREKGAAPYRTQRISTFSANTGQAQDLADWLLGQFGTPSFGISSVSILTSAQNSFAIDASYQFYDWIGYRTQVTFRGSTNTMTILGVEFTADAFDSRYTFLVADADLTPYFYLDSNLYGVLDQNKLNW